MDIFLGVMFVQQAAFKKKKNLIKDTKKSRKHPRKKEFKFTPISGMFSLHTSLCLCTSVCSMQTDRLNLWWPDNCLPSLVHGVLPDMDCPLPCWPAVPFVHPCLHNTVFRWTSSENGAKCRETAKKSYAIDKSIPRELWNGLLGQASRWECIIRHTPAANKYWCTTL